MDRIEALGRSPGEDHPANVMPAPAADVCPAASGTAAVPQSVRAGHRIALLRAATSDIHAATERVVEANGFFASPANYTNYLQRLAAFHRAYDLASAGLDHSALHLFQIDRHEAWLKAELRALGRELPRPARAHAPWRLANASALLGSLYVIAGSTLGARVLCRLTVERGLPRPGGSTYLFAVAGALRWSEAVAYIEQAPGVDEDAMTAGAVATFTHVRGYLSGELSGEVAA